MTQKNRNIWTNTWIVRIATIAAFLATVRFIYIVVAIILLGMIGHNQANWLPFATFELHSSNRFVRQIAAQSLGTIGPKAAPSVPDLLASLRHDCPNVAADSACALGEIMARRANGGIAPDPEAIVALTNALNHSDGEVRRYAAYAISLIGPAASAATPKLIQLLSDPYMSYTAARALGEMGPAAQNSVQPMTTLLTDPVWAVRLEAILALSHFAPLPDATISALRICRADGDERVRDAAKKVLAQLSADLQLLDGRVK
jgi:HEAT repeat protein